MTILQIIIENGDKYPSQCGAASGHKMDKSVLKNLLFHLRLSKVT